MTDYIQSDTRLIVLSSSNATQLNGTFKSNLLFDFKALLLEDPATIHVTVGVVNAQIPVSFYTVNEYNNVLNTSIGAITITKGNYTSSSLINELQASFLAFGYTMLITINRVTGKLIFTGTSDFTFTQPSSSFVILGFNNTISSTQNVLTAPFPLNLLGIQQIKVTSNTLACYNSSSQGLGETDLLSVIQNTAPPFGMILYNNLNSFGLLKNTRVSQLDIQLKDETNEFIDFNNIDFSLTIQMTIFRKVDTERNTYLKQILKQLISNEQPDSQPPTDQPTDQPTDPTNQTFEQEDNDDSLDLLIYNNVL
tara:strand:- start:1854 stop:2780 length:927 start_codon:yes stop_codon:yes gene_type:complete